MNRLAEADLRVMNALRKLCNGHVDKGWSVHGWPNEGSHFLTDDEEEFCTALKEYETLKQYHTEANRSLIVCQMKKEIASSLPKKEKLVAVTICPEDNNLETCKSIIEVVKTVTAVHSMDYVFEQRSIPGEEPKGWHLHLNIHTLAAPSKIAQFINQKLKPRGYSAWIKAKPADDNWKNKYMSGIKGCADKDLKVAQDRIIRAQLGMLDMYTYTSAKFR